MPFTMPSFPSLTQQQTSPFANLFQNALQGYTGAIQARYLPQQIQAELAYKQAQTPYLQAQTGLTGEEAQKIQFQLQHPEYLNPESFLMSMAVGNRGNGGSQGNGNSGNVPTGINQSVAPPNLMPSIRQAEQQASQNGSAVIPYPNSSSGNVGGSNSTSPQGLSPVDQMIMQRYFPLQYKGLEQQQNLNIGQQQQRQLESSGAANNAIQLNYALNDLKKDYDQLNFLQRGSFGGHIPAIGSNAQLADQASSRLEATLAKSLQSGHITDKDLDFSKQLGIGRNLNPEAFDTLYDFTSKLQQRIMERPEFLRAAAQMGISPPDAENRWTRYEYERPVYDFDKRKPLQENLRSWQDYLTPQAGKAIQQGVDFSPNQHISKELKNSNTVTKKFVRSKSGGLQLEGS